MKLTRTACLAVLAAVSASGPARADSDYPNRPIRLIVPYAAGGISDVMARSLASRMSADLGVPITIDNKPGGNLFVGLVAANAAKPDGYTIVMTTVTSDVINPLVYQKLPYDSEGMVSLGVIAASPIVLLVPPALNVGTVADLVALAKRSPGVLNYGSTGEASSVRMVTEKFQREAGIRMTHVPFASSVPIHTALIRGDVQFYSDVTSSALPVLQSGQLKALAVASPTRVPALPDVPTMQESGYRDFQMSVWYGLRAPANTPRAVADRLVRAFNKGLADPAFREQFTTRGMVVSTTTGTAEMDRIIAGGKVEWAAMIKPLGIKLD